MKTLTLFEVYAKACSQLEQHTKYLYFTRTDASGVHYVKMPRNRRERQRNAFAAAIRARLTPPAPPRRRVHIVTVAGASVGFHRIADGASGCVVYYPTRASMSRMWRVVETKMQDISSGDSARIKTFTREVQP